MEIEPKQAVRLSCVCDWKSIAAAEQIEASRIPAGIGCDSSAEIVEIESDRCGRRGTSATAHVQINGLQGIAVGSGNRKGLGDVCGPAKALANHQLRTRIADGLDKGSVRPTGRARCDVLRDVDAGEGRPNQENRS